MSPVGELGKIFEKYGIGEKRHSLLRVLSKSYERYLLRLSNKDMELLIKNNCLVVRDAVEKEYGRKP